MAARLQYLREHSRLISSYTVARGRDYFGKHRLVRLIRAGHTCAVWEAVSEEDGQRYALKIIKPEEKHNKLEIGRVAMANCLITL